MRSNYFKYSGKLSTETIAYQKDDPFVGVSIDIFTKLYNLFKDEGLNNKNLKDNRVQSLLQSYGDAVADRFGFPKVKVLAMEGMNAACIPCPPKKDSAINRDLLSLYNELSSMAKNMDVDKAQDIVDKTKQIEDYDGLDTGSKQKERALYTVMANSMASVDKQVKLNGGLKLNNKEARIENLPSDYMLIMIIGVYDLFFIGGLSPKEVAAIMLHEVGHAYTHIEYSYRSAVMTTSINDSLKIASNKGYSTKETLLLVGEVASKDKDYIAKNKDKNIIAITLNTLDAIVSNEGLRYSNLNSIDSEQKADEFASMFGLGVELTSALEKFQHSGAIILNDIRYGSILPYLAKIVFASMVVIYVFMSLPIVGAIIALVGAYLVPKIIITLLTEGMTTAEYTYDVGRRRIERLRLDYIRQVRNPDLPVEIKSMLADAVYAMDIIIKNSKDDDEYDLGDKLYHLLSNKASDARDAKRFEQLTEDLIENHLHADTVQLDKLLNK